MAVQRVDLLLEMLEKEPEDSFLNYALALEYAKAGDPGKAVALMEQVIKKDEEYLGAYYQLGKLYEQTQQKNKAIAVYRRGSAIARKKNETKTLNELNEALMLAEEE